jgi:cobalt-zinc-cadmium efflux system membrane fusion protein
MFTPACPPFTASTFRRLLRHVAAVALLAICAPLLAHEGHDHEEPGAAGSQSSATSVPATSGATAPGTGRDVIELNSELYEAVVVSHGDHIDIWLDRWDTNEPVTGARVGVALGDAAEVIAVEESPGQYMAAITPVAPGTALPVTLTIQATPGDDLLGGVLEVGDPGSAAAVSRVMAWLRAAWPWALGLAVLGAAALGVPAALRRRRWGAGGGTGALAAPLVGAGLLVVALAGAAPLGAHEGHDHAEPAATTPVVGAPVAGRGNRPVRLPDGSVFVPKPTQRILELRTLVAATGATSLSLRLAGEIVGDPRASAALQTLQGGRVVAEADQWPVLGARVRRGQVLLRLTPSGSAGERASAAAEVARTQADLVRAEADLARLEGLTGVVARAEIESQRVLVSSLRSQLSARRASLAAGGEPIVSPIDGVIASVEARPGVVVDPGETLLTVIDPARLSIEALAFEPVSAEQVTRASAALRDGTALEARLLGVGAQLRGGAVPVRLDLTQVAPGLVVGQSVTVFLERAGTVPGLYLPVQALVRLPSGERIVYEKVAAERFVPRTVRVRQVSADRIAVLAGLEPGVRVVVGGASLVSQIR